MLELPQNGGSLSHNGSHKVRFGEFEADFRTGEVRKAGNRVKLQEQPFKILQILLENPGNLVSREELQSRIWPEESYGDFDHAVNVAVGKLRIALGDSAEDPSFIETVPRRGYRFVAAVEDPPIAPPAAKPLVRVATDVDGKTRHRFRVKAFQWASLAVIICAGLVRTGVWLGLRSVRSQPAEIQRLTVNRGTVYAARFAPDGRSVIYSAKWEGSPVEMFSTDVRFQGSRSMGLAGADLLAVSSAGEMAILQPAEPKFMTGLMGTMGKAPLTGGASRQIAENVDWADWSPDGKALAVVHDVAGKERLEFPLGHVLYETSGWISHVRFSPNGRKIAFLDHPIFDDDEGGVTLVDLEGRRTVLSTGWECEEGLAWSANGKEVWFSATHAGLQLRIYAVDLSGHLRLAFRALGGVTLQDIAPDGRVLMTRDDHRAGIMGKGPGAGNEQDLSWQDWSLPVDISRDGRTLLFDEQGEKSGPNYTVAMRDMTGSPPVALGDGVAGDFSPDGRWAAATVAYQQLLLLPTGAGTVRRIDRGDIQQYGPMIHWEPNGKEILFTGNEAGHAARCFVQNISGGRPHPVTPEGISWCQISPDGRLIAASKPWGLSKPPQHAKSGEALLYPIDGGAPRSIPGLQIGESVEWTSDPDYLYVVQRDAPSIRVFRLNIRTGQRKFFKDIAVPHGPGVCNMGRVLFNPDGSAYVYGYIRLLSDLYLVTGLK